MAVEKEDDFMSNLLSTMDASKPSFSRSQTHQQRPAPRKRKSSPALETSSDGESHNLLPPSLVKKGRNNGRLPAPLDGLEQYDHHETPLRAQKRPKFDPELEGKVSELSVEDHVGDIAVDCYSITKLDMDAEVDIDVKPVLAAESASAPQKDAQSWITLHSTLLAAPDEPEEALDASGTSTAGNVDVIETDGSLQLYWIDFTEIQGKLYLIGKALDKTSNKYVSCCLGIDGLERNLFVAPRERVLGGSPAGDAFHVGF